MTERGRDRKWSMQVTALYDYEPEQEAEADKSSNIIKNEVQGTENANAESAAASVIARCYRRHVGIIRTNCEHERKLSSKN
ncbi:NifU protein 5 [Phytophthora nicotianae]|uniref:NifU protein 5 n=1 Tax=Phytophthora nicotianae TaxID=4792 RepID=A0A0W8D9B2_PHYNI|nr:NifU protein 5 [Phytophthora nicotianae]